MLLWHSAYAAAGALLYCVHMAARMLPHHSCLSLLVPSAKRSWRGWDCRLEPVPLSAGLMFHLLYVLWGQQLSLSAPTLFPVSWLWILPWLREQSCHVSVPTFCTLTSLGDGTSENTHLCLEHCGWLHLGYKTTLASASKQTFPLWTLC